MTRELVYGFLVALFIIALETASLFFVIPAHGAECAGQVVTASWYGIESCRPHKRCQTATGLKFNGKQWLVAHRTLPFGTKLRLSYNGRSVVVPVGDRGPYIKGRTLDLSRAVAVKLRTLHSGVVKLCMERVGW